MTSDTRQDAISRRVAILVTFWQIGWNWNDSCFFHDSFCFFCNIIILHEITLWILLWTLSLYTNSRKSLTKLVRSVRSNFVSFYAARLFLFCYESVARFFIFMGTNFRRFHEIFGDFQSNSDFVWKWVVSFSQFFKQSTALWDFRIILYP